MLARDSSGISNVGQSCVGANVCHVSPASSYPSAEHGPRIVVCGWSGAGNVGDELLTAVVVEKLRRLGAIPIVVARDPGETSRLHGVETIRHGVRGLAAALGRIPIAGVCVGPGGIIQDSTSARSMPGHLLLPWMLRMRGRPVAGAGLGADPLKRGWSRRLLRAVLKDTPVAVRDHHSAKALAASGVAASVGADLAFCLDLGPLPRRPEIVAALGPSLAPGILGSAERRLRADDPQRVAHALEVVAERLDVALTLLSFRGRPDRDFAKAVASRCRLECEVVASDVDQQVDRIRSARLLISSRYHPIVVAASSGTAAIALSEQAKVVALVEQLNSPLVRQIDDLAALERCELPQPDDYPIVPEGLGRHQEVLSQLVELSFAG